MTEYYTIALDVGRTFTRSALLDEHGNILPNSFSIFSSKLCGSKESILNNFIKMIKFNINSILTPNFKIQHIGFAFSNGAKLNKNSLFLDKKILYSSLMNMGSVKGKLSENCQIHFMEDAPLFAVGEHVLRNQENQRKRVLYLILGSSFSSAFMVNGRLEINRYTQQKSHNLISHHGILLLAEEHGIITEEKGPKEIAEMAIDNHPKAVKVYEKFGEYLARMLEDLIFEVSPDEIILGGNIALSYPLFSQSLKNTLRIKEIDIYPTEHTTYYIFFGISEYIKKLNH